MVPATVTPTQLGHADAWPPAATIYDTQTHAFLSAIEAAALAQGIDKRRRHSLVFRPLVEAVPGVLFEGYNILSAPPKIGKTIIAHQLMIAVDMGRDWLDRPVRQGPVLFFGLEDSLASATARERRLLGDGLEEFVTGGAGQVMVTDAGPTPVERFARLSELLDAGHRGTPWGLVVIDTAPRFLGNGSSQHNAYERGLELMTPLDQLGLRHHVPILGIHHDRKASDGDDFDAVSGGLSITGTAQSVLSLRRTRGGDTGVLSVYPRSAPERKFAVEFDDGIWKLSPTMAAELAEEAAGARRDVLELLLDHPGGLSLQDIVTRLRQHTYANLQQALHRLQNAGKIRIRNGVWSTLETARPHTADHTPPVDAGAGTVKAPADAAAASEPSPAHPVAPTLPRPLAPIAVDDPGVCDTCGGTPARIHTRTGARHCATCRPELFRPPLGAPPPDPVPPAPAEHPPAGQFRRPDWAPDPLDHPITVWQQRLEASFAHKKVQLILHPYPKDEDIPEPYRKRGQGRGSLLHEGAHHWRSTDIPAGTVVTVIDRNGSYLGQLGTADIPIGALREHAGRGPENEAGAHLIDHWPAWHDPTLPHPGGSTPKGPRDAPVWILSAQLRLMLPFTGPDGPLEPFTVVRSFTGRSTRLEKLQADLRDARWMAIEQGDTEAEQFWKAVYSIGLATSGESSHNTQIWRPDWPPPIRGSFHANNWRAAKRARDHGLTVAALLHTDELHLVGDPFHTCFTEGRKLNQWKRKLDDNGQPLTYPWEPPRDRR